MTRFFVALLDSWRDSAALRLALAAVTLCALLIVLNGMDRLVVRVDIESATSAGTASIYYDDGGGFREEASVARSLRAGLHRYEFPLPVTRINAFRIDPSNHDQATRISGLEARSRGKLIKRFDASTLHAANDIAQAHVEDGAVRFSVRKGGTDPYFVVSDSALEASADVSWFAANLFTAIFVTLSVALVAGFAAGTPREGHARLFRFGVVAGLVIAMALLASTKYSVSPDEFDHLEAGRYYLERWLPPKVGDEATLDSYSVYGASYVNEPDVVYLVAAKFVVATAFLGLDELVRFRLFNVCLLLLCALLAAQRRFAFWLTLPLLCTPQVWYVFAYFNADAFAVATATLLGASVLVCLERAEARPGQSPTDWRAVLVVGALLALAFLSRRTFYPFIVFSAAYVFWRAGLRDRLGYTLGIAGLALLALWSYSGAVGPAVTPLLPDWGRGLVGAATVALLTSAVWLVFRHRAAARALPRALLGAAILAGLLVAARFGLEMAINGSPAEHARALAALAERIAAPEFRPSAFGTSQSYFSLALASRGVGLQEMLFAPYQWLDTTRNSFFGVYGYLSVVGPPRLYFWQRVIALAFVAAICAACRKDEAARGTALLGIAFMGLTVLFAILNSWVRDLQAQGRYLLVALPILGVMAAEAARAAPDGLAMRLARLSAMALWILGVWSFAFIGLPGIPRP